MPRIALRLCNTGVASHIHLVRIGSSDAVVYVVGPSFLGLRKRFPSGIIPKSFMRWVKEDAIFKRQTKMCVLTSQRAEGG